MKSQDNYFRAIAVIAAILGLLITIAMAQPGTFKGKPIIKSTWLGEPAEYVAGEILVKFQDGNVSPDGVIQSVNGKLVRGVEPNGFSVIEVNENADIPLLCTQIHNRFPLVDYAEPNLIYTIQEWTPNDQYYPDSTWSLLNTGQAPPGGIPDADINVNWAWDYTHGSSSVVLAILDTGIDMDTASMTLRHFDLNETGKIILGADFIGDGYGVADLHSHGTHVAGIASAETDNTWGIAGVAEYCKILVIQVFDQWGYASTTSVSDGINYAVSYQAIHPTERVIMSYSGGGSSYSATTYAALQNAETADVPFVTASGNQHSSTCLYPCQHSSEFDNVICVGGTDPWDLRADYSNYCVDVNVVAPGGFGSPYTPDDIFSCLLENTYGRKAGTSMATPHVTGICGLVVAQNMSITSANLKALIEETADDEVGLLTDDPQGYDTKYGHGRANAWSAVIHSPTYVTPYMRQNQRLSNTYSSVGENISYRLAPPPNGKWEIAAARPHSTINTTVYLRNASAVTVATSALSGDTVDFVLARNRPTTGNDFYARIYNTSGSGKYCAEYQQAEESYIGSMYKYDYQWESSHVVEIYEVYLQNNHRYLFRATMLSGEVDLGLALIGPAGVSATYTNRASAVIDIDNSGSGSTEYTYYTITSGDGWYAFVLYSKNGRNGVMDVLVEERVNNDAPSALLELDAVQVTDGYFYTSLASRSTMGVVGIRPETGNNYGLAMYNTMDYSGSYLVYSNYGTGYVDFFLWDQSTVSGQKYPRVTYSTLSPGNTGYTILKEENDDYLSIGVNGPNTFNATNIIKAWDVNLTSGTQYHFAADITSGTLDIGFAIFKKDADYKARSSYFLYDYTGGPGVDEYFEWLCDSTGYYTVVAWSRNGEVGTYYINFDNYPNLDAYVPTGWDYEFVPRNTSGASYSSCPITATLPGNTVDTRLNWIVRNNSVNSIPSSPTFYTHLYLDGSFLYDRPWTSGLAGNAELHFTNWTTTTPIRGGKHTVELREDGTGIIAESNESDNSYFRQFVWSPYVLSNGVPVTRTPAPPYSSMWTQPNCDGFQYTRTASFAYGVAVCPVLNADYELRLYDDYTGSEQGFDSLRAFSSYVSGYTDYAVATYSGVQPTVYPGIYHYYSSPGSGDFVIHAVDANGRILTATDIPRRDTLSANEILQVYEAYLTAGIEYVIATDSISGAADIALYVYGPNSGYYPRGNYIASSNTTGLANEELLYTPASTSYHVIVVTKPYYTSLSQQSVYDVSVALAPPNLATTVPTGWDYEVVPRSTGGALYNNCPITATLPGNTSNTYLNFSGINNSNIAITDTFYNQLYLDGGYFFQRLWTNLPLSGNTTFYHLNWTTTTPIRGGKHTIQLRLDGDDDIVESSETDNTVSHQYIWSPYILTNNVPVTRDMPPPISYMYPQTNCDGFKYTRTGAYAYAVAECPLASPDDYNLRLYDDYTGSEEGFDSLRALSGYGDGVNEFIVATYTNVASTVYAGVYDYDGDGTDDFAIHAIDTRDRILNAAAGEVRRDTLSDYELIHVYEAYLVIGNEYVIDLNNVNIMGSTDLDLALYGPSYGYYDRGEYEAVSATVGDPLEQIIYTPAVTAYYVIAVYRPNSGSFPAINDYTISVGSTDLNLTCATPTGWDFPAVPRNAGGATFGSCVLTDTLPGNTANTYYNYSSYNEGPGPEVDYYNKRVLIDSVLAAGTTLYYAHAPGQFLWNVNSLSSLVVTGGRHTLGLSIDHFNVVVETDETDNWWSHQFIWTPYLLSNHVPVTRNAPPQRGSSLYPNCDGFEFTTGWWGAVGILSNIVSENYDVKLFAPWIDSENGFGSQLTASAWAAGYIDFVVTTDQTNGSETYNIGVVQSQYNPGTNPFVIQQANEQATWYTPGTYGPYTIASGEVMALWEVNLTPAGSYSFEVDVISGTADIETSIYAGDDSTHSKSEYFPGGHSNSASGGGDEAFTIASPYSGMYFGWAVFKESSADRTLSSTFYLTWGPAIAPVPEAVDDLVIERLDSTGARLTWSPVTQDTSGNPLVIDYYRIHRNLNPGFVPSLADSIGYTTGTAYNDLGVVWTNQKYFYQVIAVDTDGVVAAGANGDDTVRAVTGRPPRADAPEAIRNRHRE